MTKKLIKKELDNLSCFICNKEIIFVAKTFSKKENLRARELHWKFCNMFKGRNNSNSAQTLTAKRR